MTTQPFAKEQEALSKSRLRLWLRILKLSSGIETELRRRLREEHSTTLPRFDVLSALSRYPEGLKMSELSGHLRVSNGNVTGIVDRLSEEGLVLRVAVHGDRRAQLARLTQKGHETFATLAAHHEIWIDELLRNVTREDALHLMTLLDTATRKQESE